MAARTQVSTGVDFDRAGKQQGALRVPCSTNDSGWGNLLIPVTVVANGRGPTVLALGGTHGDEFEGPVALMKLAGSLRPEQVSGRIIIIPCLNLPAVRAGTRLSPIDNVNLNRAFPGKENDTTTGLIAHYLSNILFPMADVVMDLHSGGRSMVFLPCAHLHRVPDDEQFHRMLAAAKAWGQPTVFIYADVAGEGLLPVQAERMGKTVVTTEMGGGAQCSPEVLAITERGLRNVLIQQGLLSGAIDANPESVRVVAATEREDYHIAPADGIYESFYEVGATVVAGQPLGQLHFPERCDCPPETVIAHTSGVLVCRRYPGTTRQGDCVATVARYVEV